MNSLKEWAAKQPDDVLDLGWDIGGSITLGKDLDAYGTSEGVRKEWDERGRGRHEKIVPRKPKGFLNKQPLPGGIKIDIEADDGPFTTAERKDLDEKLGMPADQFAKALVSHFKKGELNDVSVTFRVNPYDKMDDKARDIEFTLVATLPDAGIVTMERRLNLNMGVAYHNTFSISNKSDQGKDIAKRLLDASLDLYDNLGIKKISTFANSDVGGYAWARYGFVPDEESWEKLQKGLTRTKGGVILGKFRPDIADHLSSEAQDVAWKILHSNNPRSIRALAALKDPHPPKGEKQSAGKILLLGSDWDGVLNLENKKDYSTIREYVSHAS